MAWTSYDDNVNYDAPINYDGVNVGPAPTLAHGKFGLGWPPYDQYTWPTVEKKPNKRRQQQEIERELLKIHQQNIRRIAQINMAALIALIEADD